MKTLLKKKAKNNVPLDVGDQLENLEVLVYGSDKKRLKEFCGSKGLVLYFYPKDDTPGCTIQACDFRDSISQVKWLGYNILGASADSLESHMKFTEKYNLPFPLLVDQKHELMNHIGAWGSKRMYGNIFQGIIRTTCVVDPKLEITHIYRNVRAKGHVERLLKDLV